MFLSILSAFHVLPHLVLTASIRGRHYHPQLLEEAESQVEGFVRKRKRGDSLPPVCIQSFPLTHWLGPPPQLISTRVPASVSSLNIWLNEPVKIRIYPSLYGSSRCVCLSPFSEVLVCSWTLTEHHQK